MVLSFQDTDVPCFALLIRMAPQWPASVLSHSFSLPLLRTRMPQAPWLLLPSTLQPANYLEPHLEPALLSTSLAGSW